MLPKIKEREIPNNMQFVDANVPKVKRPEDGESMKWSNIFH